MDNNLIYDLLVMNKSKKWELQAAHDNVMTKERADNVMSELKADMPEKSKHLLDSFALFFEDYFHNLYYDIGYKIFCTGIKIGLDLQTEFNNLDDDNC